MFEACFHGRNRTGHLKLGLIILSQPRRMMKEKTTYKKAGVDIDAGSLFVERIKPFIKSTARKEVMSSLGGYTGLFNLDPALFKKPLLVSSTDGVGTKIRIAQMMNRHDTIGIDLVAMSVNDIIVQGAEPLFFLDYLATGKIDVDKHAKIIEGIARGCKEAGCALIGGETAEMPGFYQDDDYDLAGFAVGIVEEDRVIDGTNIRLGDALIGIASSGLHSNGYSLAREVLFNEGGLKATSKLEDLELSLGEELLTPTKIYVKTVLNLIKGFNVKGIAHITGGGIIDNLPRVIPKPTRALLDSRSWEVPPIFRIIKDIGQVDDSEMFRTFNMGVGLVLIVSERDSKEILERISMLGEKAWLIGQIDKREEDIGAQILIN